MSNTYTQIHIHSVFCVQNRQCLIQPEWKDELYKYMTGIIQAKGHKLLAINGMPDHVHVFFGMRPEQSLSMLMKSLKGDSSFWINDRGFIRGRFSWQEGYGAFSYARSQVSSVIKYIRQQDEHHRRKSFLDEYREMLRSFEVAFDEKYLFREV